MRTPAASADVVVVGLGAMGSHALWRLAERGVRAIGVEQFTPGHDRGSSHGESRIIRTAYSEGAGYVPLVLHAWRLWDELEARSGQRLLERCGGLMLGSPSSPWVRGATESAKDHGLRYELLSGSELRERFPQHRVDDDDTVGFFEAAAGVVRPARGCRGWCQGWTCGSGSCGACRPGSRRRRWRRSRPRASPSSFATSPVARQPGTAVPAWTAPPSRWDCTPGQALTSRSTRSRARARPTGPTPTGWRPSSRPPCRTCARGRCGCSRACTRSHLTSTSRWGSGGTSPA